MITESAAVSAFSVNKPREGAQSIMIKSYLSFIKCKASFNFVSRETTSTKPTSAPAN